MKKKIGTTLSLTKKQICFLESVSKDCKFSGGRKLSRTSIFRALLSTAGNLCIDVEGVKSEEELMERVLSAFKKKQ
jgi:hypothetical protein